MREMYQVDRLRQSRQNRRHSSRKRSGLDLLQPVVHVLAWTRLQVSKVRGDELALGIVAYMEECGYRSLPAGSLRKWRRKLPPKGASGG